MIFQTLNRLIGESKSPEQVESLIKRWAKDVSKSNLYALARNIQYKDPHSFPQVDNERGIFKVKFDHPNCYVSIEIDSKVGVVQDVWIDWKIMKKFEDICPPMCKPPMCINPFEEEESNE